MAPVWNYEVPLVCLQQMALYKCAFDELLVSICLTAFLFSSPFMPGCTISPKENPGYKGESFFNGLCVLPVISPLHCTKHNEANINTCYLLTVHFSFSSCSISSLLNWAFADSKSNSPSNFSSGGGADRIGRVPTSPRGAKPPRGIPPRILPRNVIPPVQFRLSIMPLQS